MAKILASALHWPNSQVFRNKNTTIKVQRPEGFTLDRAHTLSNPGLDAGVRSRTAVVFPKMLKASLAVLLLLGSISLSVAYLFSVNSYASSGYAIQKLQKQIAIENDSIKDLQRKVSEGNSVLSLDQKFTTMGFVPVTGAEFISIDNKQVSQK